MRKANVLKIFLGPISALGIFAVISLLGWAVPASGQQVNSGPRAKSERVDPAAPDAVPSTIKVTFDDAVPGTLIVEANGEKVRVDPVHKTVEPISAPVANAAGTPDSAAPAPAQEEATESQYDFDPGFEPYDYRLINVPTPRSVPKGTWNLSFTHRFAQPLRPIRESAPGLFGFDSMSASSFGISYGLTNKLYVNAYRSPLCQKGLCRTVEVGLGYHWLDQKGKSPIALSTYASIEGNDNFTEEYTYNFQAMIARSLGKRLYLFFSPAVHLNANGQRRFNPRPSDYFPPAAIAESLDLGKHTASFGFGTGFLLTPSLVALFEYTPRIGFKMGRVDPVFNANFDVVGFNRFSEPEIAFGVQKNIGKHSFTITFSNTQTTTTARYNSSNLVLSPKNFVLGFNLFRRW